MSSASKPDGDPTTLLVRGSSGKPQTEVASLAKDVTFWAELTSTGGLGALMFWALDLEDLGQIVWIVGSILIAHRYLIDVRLRQERKVVSEKVEGLETHIDELVSEIVNLRKFLGVRSEIELADQDSALNDMQAAVHTFFTVTEPELQWLRNEQLEEFQKSLWLLNHDKRSRILHRAEYYAWLLPEIEAAPVGSAIWAVSRMMDCEWDNSPEEVEFLRLNLEAASRGVHVTRLFLCEADVWQEAIDTLPPVREQLAHDGRLDVYFGDLASIHRRDSTILSAIGSGLFAFDRRVVLVDQHSTDGTARGYVSANPQEIRNLRNNFDRLKNLCTKQKAAMASPRP